MLTKFHFLLLDTAREQLCVSTNSLLERQKEEQEIFSPLSLLLLLPFPKLCVLAPVNCSLCLCELKQHPTEESELAEKSCADQVFRQS